MNSQPNLRSKIEVLKHAKRLSFNKISQQIGITESALHGIMERDDCKLSTLYKLAEVLDVSILEMLLNEKELSKLINEKDLIPQGNTEGLQVELEGCLNRTALLEELLKSRNELIEEMRKKES